MTVARPGACPQATMSLMRLLQGFVERGLPHPGALVLGRRQARVITQSGSFAHLQERAQSRSLRGGGRLTLGYDFDPIKGRGVERFQGERGSSGTRPPDVL